MNDKVLLYISMKKDLDKMKFRLSTRNIDSYNEKELLSYLNESAAICNNLINIFGGTE